MTRIRLARRTRRAWLASHISRRSKLLLAILGASLVVIIGGLFYLGGMVSSGLVSLEREASSEIESTKIFDRKGKLLYEILNPRSGKHTPVSLQEIPIWAKEATLAAEDVSFYDNPGIDPVGIIRAALLNRLHGRVLFGGSTITQQLVRNKFLSFQEASSPSLTRKIKEAILALEMSRRYTKDQILEMYLNEMYYGNFSYGVEAAALSYFGKHVKDLDLAECALLAGILQSPSRNNPFENFPAVKRRQESILDLMVKAGFITEAQAASAKAEKLTLREARYDIRAPHFVQFVLDQLWGKYSEQFIASAGLKIYTTLDLDLQEEAQNIARRHVAELSDHSLTNASVVALDPRTGEILVMLGSLDYFDEAIDGAVNMALAKRQPGSAIKPITYAAAFEKDYTPATVIEDERAVFTSEQGEIYLPLNYDGKFHGPVRVREALANSYNVPAVKVLHHIGMPAFLTTAREMGITTFHNDKYWLSVTLGGGEVRLLDLVSAYGALANRGVRAEPFAISKIVDSQGNILFQQTPVLRPVLGERGPAIAYLISDILSDNSARIPSFGPNSPLKLSFPAAAKTGTTTDYRDNWAVGYTPELVTGVWVGNSDNAPMKRVSGITGAAPIWHDFMEFVLKGKSGWGFQKPEDIVEVEICPLSGLLPGPNCQITLREKFIKGTEPREVCSMHSTYTTYDSFQSRSWKETMDSEESQEAQIVEITNPQDGDRFVLDPTIPLRYQQLELAVDASEDISAVTWYVDGRPIGTIDKRPFSTFWVLKEGNHFLKVVGLRAGRPVDSQEVEFFVSLH
ncbi:penicillin-binding protein 1A [Candidatus Hakubella thermalkaliphila]|uniref:Penicillin-binding protein 1A n=1 Tax=Candidatus Hakubella thermalkaliphila TaxID=2754717 RepID=A0A6V8NIY9_9ACTN|nr:PBP1A family penicillin-binding protein [Candidatus Hakubella thermalkaliphila]GFP19331.1 penicillin-binding protein 1A [Candidatus Hakubella thermalkaliphila]GFP22840.1 penicillin-binding protein 1A [Candidatus Hakubella thermalkaliphila]GFP38408.1 penicillin-binding protein 1A [Candidatus Hakubella thermalkaliphila]GFP40952.1 penicillin-binding protein 1A [Candidatus Hakubella thermalkaliphila]